MEITEILKACRLNSGASEEAIHDAELALGYSLPSDYVKFLRAQNGVEGFVGNNYLIIWRVEELSPFNAEYEAAKYVPGLVLFASSGGGAGYGFDTREVSMPVVSVEFIGMDWSEADRVAGNFTEFLNSLAG